MKKKLFKLLGCLYTLSNLLQFLFLSHFPAFSRKKLYIFLCLTCASELDGDVRAKDEAVMLGDGGEISNLKKMELISLAYCSRDFILLTLSDFIVFYCHLALTHVSMTVTVLITDGGGAEGRGGENGGGEERKGEEGG